MIALPHSHSLDIEVTDDIADAGRYRAAWDELAQTVERPYCAPAWMLSWFRNCAPPGAQPRIIVARDDGRVVGLAPFFLHPGRFGMRGYRLLGAGSSHRIEPLAQPGREGEVASVVASTLAGFTPAAVVTQLEGVDGSSAWPAQLREAWPGSLRPRLRREFALGAPTLDLGGQTFDSWLASRSANFRQQMLRRRRRVARAGAHIYVCSDDQQLRKAMPAFARLHYARWASRGGSRALDVGMERTILEAGLELVESGRLQLWILEAEGRPVSAQLFVRAGGELAYWGGGFEASWEREAPSQLVIFSVVEHAISTGVQRVDFAGGVQPYKLRFANGDHPIVWWSLFPLNARYAVTQAQMQPRRMRRTARMLVNRLPPGPREQVKRAARAARLA